MASQATINVAVNVQNLIQVKNLATAFTNLRDIIIAMQRSTQGVSGAAKAGAAAVNAQTNAAVKGAKAQAAGTTLVTAATQRRIAAALQAMGIDKKAAALVTGLTKDQAKVLLDVARVHKSTTEARIAQEKAAASIQHTNAQTALVDAKKLDTESATAERKRTGRDQRRLIRTKTQSVADTAASLIETRNIRNTLAASVTAATVKAKNAAAGLANTRKKIALEDQASRKERQAAADAARAEREKQQAFNQEVRLLQRVNELNARQARQQQEQIALEKQLKSSVRARLSYYERSLDAIFRAAYRLKQVGNDMKMFGQNIFQTISTFTDQFGEFEFMAGRAAGALGDFAIGATDEANKNFIDLQNTVIKTSEELRLFTATDTAKALYFLASTTGQVVKSQEDLDNIMIALQPIMQAAALTQTDYETTIKGVYSILTQYNGELIRFAQTSGDYTLMSRKMREITIDLFYVAQKTAAEFNDLVNSFKMVGPVAKQSGASFEDILDLLGRLADLGIRGTMAGRALRQMFIQMVRPSGPATAALNQLFSTEKNLVEFNGKNYKQLMFPKGTFVGTTQYINILARALEGASQQERNYLLSRISTANELPALQALIAQETARMQGDFESLSKTTDMNAKAEETFTKAWDRLKNSWQGTTAALQRGIEALQIAIGRNFADAFKPFVEQIRTIVDRIREWVNANPALVAEIGKVAGVIAGLSVAVGTVISLAGSLIGLAAAGTLIVGAFGPAIPIITTITTLFAALGMQVVARFDEIQASLQAFQAEIERAFSILVTTSASGENAIQGVMDIFKVLADIVITVGKTIFDTTTSIIRAINDVGLTAPLIKGLAAALAVLFGQRIIRGIQQLILSTRLFKTEMKTAFEIQTITNARGLTQQMIVQTQVVNATGIGYRIAAVAADLWATAQLRLAYAVPILSTAVLSLGRAMGTAVSFATGPYGIIAALAAMTAYDMNFFGLKDAISGVTQETRNLNEELNAAKQTLGDLGLRTQRVVEKFGIPNYQDILNKALNVGPSRARLGQGRMQLKVFAFGEQFTQIIEGMFAGDKENPQKIEEARNKLIARLDERRQTLITDMVNWISDTKEGLNQRIVAAGGQPIDTDALIAQVLGISENLQLSPKRVLEIYTNLVDLYGPAFTLGEATKYISTLVDSGKIEKNVGTALADALYNPNALNDQIASEARSKRLISAKKIYGPIADGLARALKSGNQDEVVRLLSQAAGTWIGGTFIETGKSLASLPPSLIADLGYDTLVQEALSGLDPSVVDSLTGEDMFGGDQTAPTIAELVTSRLQDDFYKAHSIIMDKAEILLSAFAGGVLDGAINLPGVQIQQKNAYKQIADFIVDPSSGETILDYVKQNKSLEGALGGLGPIYQQIIEQGIAEGWIDGVKRSYLVIPEEAKATLAAKAKMLALKIQDIKGFSIPISVPIELVDVTESINALGSLQDKAIRLLNPEVNKFSDRIINTLKLGLDNAKNAQQVEEAYKLFFSSSFNGQDIVQLSKDENVSSEVRTAFSTILQGAVSLGFVDQSVLDAINGAGSEDGAKSISEYIGAFTDAFDSAKGFREALKEALKRGSTRKEFGTILRSFTSKDIRRALKGNLTSRALGLDQIASSTTGLISGLMALKPSQRKQQAAMIARFFLVNKNNIPKDAKGSMGEILQYIVDNTNIKPKQKEKIQALLASLVSPEGTTTATDAGSETVTSTAASMVTASTDPVVIANVATAGSNLATSFKTNTNWFQTGVDAANKVINGFTQGMSTISLISSLPQEDWYNNGKTSGETWAKGLSDGMADFILGLNVVKDNTEGQSPPKKGPLKNIDKGGFNVGKAYGKGITKGMHHGIRKGLAVPGLNPTGAMSMSFDHSSKKQINLSIDIKSDGNTQQTTIGEIRKGVRDALAAADLEHMIGIW